MKDSHITILRWFLYKNVLSLIIIYSMILCRYFLKWNTFERFTFEHTLMLLFALIVLGLWDAFSDLSVFKWFWYWRSWRFHFNRKKHFFVIVFLIFVELLLIYVFNLLPLYAYIALGLYTILIFLVWYLQIWIKKT